jgi:hypothetical protein
MTPAYKKGANAMKKADITLSAETVRIERRQYRSASPLRLLKSVLSILISGSSVMSHYPGAGRKR